MLRLWARFFKIEPYQAEFQLQQLTCKYLRSLGTATSEKGLYSEFSNARFRNILSLNFDRRIALSFPRPHFKVGPTPCPEGSHGETLYRHDLLGHVDGTQTRIWYPHGDTRKFSTLKLGVRKYGFYVVTILEARSNFSDYWRFKPSWNSKPRDVWTGWRLHRRQGRAEIRCCSHAQLELYAPRDCIHR
jgi:hypothetical protein